MKKVVLVTGGFDPLHCGHIAYFKAARKLGDKLVVGINTDAWLTRKKGKPFMPISERCTVIQNLAMVDHCVLFDDDDNTSIEAIKNVKFMYPDAHIIFANGGDRTANNIPEMVFDDVEFVFGVGGEDKKNSSSWILKEWSQPTVERAWGKYTVLDKGDGWQVKQLDLAAGRSLSDQRHFSRSEHWHVIEGNVEITLQYDGEEKRTYLVPQGHSIDIPALCWHKAVNNDETAARVIEVWMGNNLTEDDIERRD
jgi:cytidyltransferase-like protein